MSETSVQRIAYEATVDEIVDVGLRMARRTAAFRNQVRTAIVIAGIVAGLIVLAVWKLRVGTWVPGVAIGILSGLGFAFVFKGVFAKQIVTQQRKIVAEQLGGKPSLACELELRPEGLWVRQGGIESIFPWSLCIGVRDEADEVEINFDKGLSVMRNRYFASADERRAFLEEARRLSARR